MVIVNLEIVLKMILNFLTKLFSVNFAFKIVQDG